MLPITIYNMCLRIWCSENIIKPPWTSHCWLGIHPCCRLASASLSTKIPSCHHYRRKCQQQVRLFLSLYASSPSLSIVRATSLYVVVGLKDGLICLARASIVPAPGMGRVYSLHSSPISSCLKRKFGCRLPRTTIGGRILGIPSALP